MDAEHANNGLCLPYDLLVDIFRRLPGRYLAVSRCLCRAWRDIVEAHALLLPHVFPREFPGIFVRYLGYDPNFALVDPPLPRDADEPAYRRLFGDYWDCCLKQHCNGLLLITGHDRYRDSMNPYVCNPATSRYARLPLPPTPWPCCTEGMFLAFDPAISRHHEVFFFPTEKLQRKGNAQEPARSRSNTNSSAAGGAKEKVFHVLVFSSRTGQWESREFTPQHSTSRDLYDVVTTPRAKDDRTWWSAEYWHGSLYVHCHSGVLMILRCTQKTYAMIQLPRQPSDRETLYQCDLPTRYLASNERGICYAQLIELKLEVWELIESADDRFGWTQSHEADLKECDRKMTYLMKETSMQPRVQWEVVESSRNLVNLFKHNSDDESNDDCDDETIEDEHEGENEEEEGEEEEEEKHNYGNIENEEEEEQDCDDETQGNEEEEEGEEEKNNHDNIEYEEDEKQDCDDQTQGEEEEEQDSYQDDEDEDLGSTDGSVYSWNSDQHNFIEYDSNAIPDEESWGSGCLIVGFHPYKDVHLLKFSDTLVAYHLHTSRMQYLGYIYPYNHHQHARDIIAAFPYRPCYVDTLLSRASSLSS